jgi:hypothetical protein
VVARLALPNTFSATREEPGAVPSILIRQGEAGVCAPKFATLSTREPCPASALASVKAVPPAVAAAVPSPLKSL